jgi:hypothetical protein
MEAVWEPQEALAKVAQAGELHRGPHAQGRPVSAGGTIHAQLGREGPPAGSGYESPSQERMRSITAGSSINAIKTRGPECGNFGSNFEALGNLNQYDLSFR